MQNITLNPNNINSSVLTIGSSCFRNCCSLKQTHRDIVLDKSELFSFVSTENDFSFLQHIPASPFPRERFLH